MIIYFTKQDNVRVEYATLEEAQQSGLQVHIADLDMLVGLAGCEDACEALQNRFAAVALQLLKEKEPTEPVLQAIANMEAIFNA